MVDLLLGVGEQAGAEQRLARVPAPEGSPARSPRRSSVSQGVVARAPARPAPGRSAQVRKARARRAARRAPCRSARRPARGGHDRSGIRPRRPPRITVSSIGRVVGCGRFGSDTKRRVALGPQAAFLDVRQRPPPGGERRPAGLTLLGLVGPRPAATLLAAFCSERICSRSVVSRAPALVELQQLTVDGAGRVRATARQRRRAYRRGRDRISLMSSIAGPTLGRQATATTAAACSEAAPLHEPVDWLEPEEALVVAEPVFAVGRLVAGAVVGPVAGRVPIGLFSRCTTPVCLGAWRARVLGHELRRRRSRPGRRRRSVACRRRRSRR